MQEINWNTFRAKFNGKEQSTFEWLCYLLFCKEFKKHVGIPRYKNQAGVETNPIKINGIWLGWQAKFYDTPLSANKPDFIKTISTAKSRHPEINKILFYTNKDFGQDRIKTDPKYKKEIEKHAKSSKVKIVWRTASFFESPFVCEENSQIAQHFFSFQRSLVDFDNDLTRRTESLLDHIQSKIGTNGKEIKINRTWIIEKIQQNLTSSSLIILSGKAGVGKTAVIKDFYDLEKGKKPFFVFKATEFNISNVNLLFKDYGIFSFSDFINAYEDFSDKLIVIDSAEKLSEIEHQEIFQGILSALIDNKWKIIFTSRHIYLDDLKYQLIEFYKLAFKLINIENITPKELINLSEMHNFNLPDNERLGELLHNPFYLNEYLHIYKSLDNTISYSEFKNILWDKQISRISYKKNNTHIKREDCFIRIAHKRANDGCFFVKADDCDNEILQKLESDEIIQYDSNAGGYFITHDIYEDWALAKTIERAFHNLENYNKFFQEIGSSLPIRRAFRNWLSEKLFDKNEDIIALIETTISDNEIESYWKDEIIVSVLLSDYSENFIKIFESKLLENDQNLLLKTVFLLRIACKELDESFLILLGISRTEGISLKTLFTRPKGKGWECVIDFLNKHKEEIGLRHINTILPLLDDWNNKNKQGETTKNATQLALFYYDNITNNSFGYSQQDELRDKLIRIILNGSLEIKNELIVIFNDVISKKETDHRSKYYKLIHTILSSVTDSFEIAQILPEQVIRLADLFWFQIPGKTNEDFGGSFGVEENFCIPRTHFDFFPASAFQTPVYHLLRFAPNNTIKFILSLTNKTVECYSKSELKNEVEEVEIFIDEKISIKQFISNRLWNMYRGTQVSTNLLESIHMALEKWLLEIAKSTSKEILENWCKYLIKNSKSTSITAVVTSVVLAHPYKLFNVAKILFQTKQLFLYDTTRLMFDQTAFSIGYGLNYKHKIYEDERIKTYKEKHRRLSLEHLALNYQFFKSEEDSQNESKKRQEIIWNIIDSYYKQLPDKSKETDSDKMWRLYLARMDRRKMSPTTEEKDGQVLINFNPEIDPELKEFSEEPLRKSSASMKFIKLKLWSNYRFEKDEDNYKQYQQYENNIQSVISETKEIIKKLKNKAEKEFSIFNHSIPAYACSVAIRDFSDKLNQEDREFCKEVILEFVSIPLRMEHYIYQISDGTVPSIFVLPCLINLFPEDKENLKLLLFLLLLNPWKEIKTIAINGLMQNLWNVCFDDAHSLFLGSISLKPKYKDLRDKIRIENHKNKIYQHSEVQVIDRFVKKYEKELERIVSNKITYKDLSNLDKIDLETMLTAFEILPLKTENKDHKKFLKDLCIIFSQKLLIDVDRADYTLKSRFFKKFAFFILSSEKNEIEEYIKPFVDNFAFSRDMADFFSEFIIAEDELIRYEQFWIVWHVFYQKIVELCKKEGSYHYYKSIIYNYLLALPYWREDVEIWHSLKDREKLFFKKVAEDMGHHPAVLYSLSKMLNYFGSDFLDEGIFWISSIIKNNQTLVTKDFEVNTIYYIENIVRRYIFKNRQKVKKSIRIKNNIITILNFLLERGSVTGYLLREDIL